MENSDRIQHLFQKYLSRENTEGELNELLELFSKIEEPDFRELIAFNANTEMELERAEALRPALAVLDQSIRAELNKRNSDVVKIAARSNSFLRYTAAAAAVAVIVIGAYFFRSSFSGQVEQPVQTAAVDLLPGKNGATLTLANGQKILINEALAGNIATQAGVKISKTADGQIIYEITSDNLGEIAYNTLSTTRGEQTQVRLPDGSLVFLNAASSLRYPTSFARSEKREVALTGEGYFEIAKDKEHPFIVETKGQQVEVLGTHFNINSYEDEEVVKTTLIEGSVKVSSKNSTGLLKPNQQAVLYDGMVKVEPANIEEAIAWKNGLFKFENTSMKAVMRQMARWYDVEVVYEGNVPDALFTGKIYRSQNASSLLEMLKFYDLNYRVEKKKIIISP